MSTHNLETIELSIKHAKKSVDLMKSLDKLTRNRDFKQVVLEGFFEKEAIRLVTLKSDPNMQDELNQKAILGQIDAIGNFRQYLSGVMQMGRMAEKAMIEDQATREELLAEGA